ncbi:aldo-keto reductase family 1 member A1 [Patella vulgata]|uniref:aldo-keto reductase family 1 member A1 n=1 Tax=Patella vulgata TaxID=6465 RepID=UPI0021803603|nr:aldo-keto reductase family 1 member A1 [Patella vulgata]XP_050388977.1 aldo-keto reductase family 1 member A1 [Patella vulgata]
MAIPMVTFNNGNKFPILGLGTWQATKEECQNSVRTALDAGYRHIDTAYAYGNEADIGEVLQEYMKAGKLKRSDFYITTKLWLTHHQPERVIECLNISLANLKLDYVDLYLIHGPCAFEDTGTGFYPLKPDGTPAFLNLPPEKTWEGMEKAVKLGKAKNIGVSNFTCDQIDRICKIATIKPVTNQVECHAYFNQADMHRFCQQRGILLTSYGSLGSPGRPEMLKRDTDSILLDDPLIKKLADKYKKSAGQVLLRNLTQRNILVIPKSIKPARIKQNMQVFDFKLTDAEMKQIEGLQKNVRLFKNDLGKGHPEFPF